MSIQLDGLIRHLDQCLFPQDKLDVIDNISKWVNHAIHESNESNEEEADAKQQRVMLVKTTLIKRTTVLNKDIATTQKMISNTQEKVNDAVFNCHNIKSEIEAFIALNIQKKKEQQKLIESVRTERQLQQRAQLLEMRATEIQLKQALDMEHVESSKHHSHLHLLQHEYNHLIEEIEKLDEQILALNTLIQQNLSHHVEHEASRDYLERRKEAIHFNTMKQILIEKAAHTRRVAMLDHHEKKMKRLQSNNTPVPPSIARRKKYNKKSVKSPKLKAAQLRSKEYAKQLNEYIQTPKSTNGKFGRTTPRHARWEQQMMARTNKWNQRESDQHSTHPDAITKNMKLIFGSKNMKRRTKIIKTKETKTKKKNEIRSATSKSPTPTSPSSSTAPIYKVLDNVWIQYKNYPEFYPGVIHNVHTATGENLYDVLYDLDGSLAMGIHISRLKNRLSASKIKSIHHIEEHDHSNNPMSLSLEKEMEEDHVIENIFRKAKTHTNWGRDFRVQWDAETKKARTDLVSKENEDIEMQLKNHDSKAKKTNPSYSYLDQIFHDKNPPIGRHNRFWIVPRGYPKLANELPKLSADDEQIQEDEEEDEDDDDDDDDEYYEDEPVEMNSGMDLALGFMARLELNALNAIPLNASMPVMQTPATFMTPSRTLVGGVPLRCDMASSKLHASYLTLNKSPHRPSKAAPWKFEHGVIKKQRHIKAPLHSPR